MPESTAVKSVKKLSTTIVSDNTQVVVSESDKVKDEYTSLLLCLSDNNQTVLSGPNK
ncbi:MAG: hypothetical protein GKC53_06100 [Neisseriaceae bacterium]|nr:MAG: hypothetical protein GKC53_06100 [Neisseriaceae bacterium]